MACYEKIKSMFWFTRRDNSILYNKSFTAYINIVIENEELNPNSFKEFQDKVIKNYKAKHFSGFYVIESRIFNISRV